MSGVGNRAAILTLSRLANYGLMLISPIILVRLLTVEQFGRYREFLLYGSVLQALAIFSINHSLLYCIPAQPLCRWRTVRQTTVLIGATSLLTVAVLVVADRVMGGRLVGTLLLPLCAYTLFSVNLDFWDFYWVATERTGLVFIYSGVRLSARVAVATITAALTHDVRSIIWGLVALEGFRLLAAAAVVLYADRSASEPPLEDPWRQQVRYCVPSGIAAVLQTFNGNLGSLVVAKVLGPVSLAQFAIGRFGEPVVLTLRNSVSGVLLPEMVRRSQRSREFSLELWRRATVVNTILLFPVIVIVARFARPLVGTVFGHAYLEAALLLQIYMVVVARECFDFAPALRSLGRTQPLVESNVASFIACGALLAILVPSCGVTGAMSAFAVGAVVDASWLAYRTLQAYRVSLWELLPWANIGKTAAAAGIASLLLATSAWTRLLGFGGIVAAGAVYVVVFALLLLAARVPEAQLLLQWARRLAPAPALFSRKA